MLDVMDQVLGRSSTTQDEGSVCLVAAIAAVGGAEHSARARILAVFLAMMVVESAVMPA